MCRSDLQIDQRGEWRVFAMTDRVCKECKQTLPETKFKAGVTKAGKPFRVNKCYACVYKKDQAK